MPTSRKRSRSPNTTSSYPIQPINNGPPLHQVSLLYDPQHHLPSTLKNRTGHPLIQLSQPHHREIFALDVTAASSVGSNSGAIGNRSLVAMAGMDKFITLWDVFGKEIMHQDDKMNNATTATARQHNNQHDRTCYTLRAHKNAVTSLAFVNREPSQSLVNPNSSSDTLISSSADSTCILWDLNLMKMRRRFRGHDTVVNEAAVLQMGPSSNTETVQWASVSDDATLKLWDERDREPIHSISLEVAQLTVDASRASDPRNVSGNNATLVACAGLDNCIRIYDTRRLDQEFLKLDSHSDTITSVKFSPDQCSVASFSMDQSIMVHDVKSYSSLSNRVQKKLYGPTHGTDNNLIRLAWANYDPHQLACGSSDANVYIFDTLTGKLKSKLRGHSGTVNDVCFHPQDPILCSCSSDHSTIVGDISF